jgi:hypothetical protein
VLNEENDILNNLCDTWGIDQTQLIPTAARFFNEYKKLTNKTNKQDQQILNLQMKFAIKDDKKAYFIRSDQPDPTIYFSFLPQFAESIQQLGKGVVFISDSYVMGLLGDPKMLDLPSVVEIAKGMATKEVKMNQRDQVKFDFKEKGKKPITTKGVCMFSITGAGFNIEKLAETLQTAGFGELE